MQNQESYFRHLFEQINRRSVEATVGVLGIKSNGLRQHLRAELSDRNNPENRLLSDPVFEATYPWQPYDRTFNDLSGELLNPALVEAMDQPPTNVTDEGKRLDLSGQKLSKDWKPYKHQVEAWEVLQNQKKSLIVTSGTGSGKTECFMVPILNDLISQSQQDGRLEGVQALFLYPLNALINSQKERLMAWTHPSGDKVRYCLYNGNTKRQINAKTLAQKSQNEVHDRKRLWESPPPLLITNPTMLEYILIRQQDSPILEKSQGKLKYIVLDEAHTYIGSQAAELSLLIRRALIGFGVKAENVRFIATSATIGEGDEAERKLKRYLAEIAGISEEQIELVGGERDIPAYPKPQEDVCQTLQELEKLPNDQLREVLPKHPIAQAIQHFLTHDGQAEGKPKKKSTPRTLKQLRKKLSQALQVEVSDEEMLGWLDLLSRKDEDGETFLPLRGHFFHRTLHGLWACVDKDCKEKSEHLKNTDWAFGQVYTSQRTQCDCGAPVYEVVFCADCSTEHLKAEQKPNGLFAQPDSGMGDEFELELERSEDDQNENTSVNQDGVLKVIGPHETTGLTERTYLDTEGVRSGKKGKQTPIYINEDADCTHCGYHRNDPKNTFRPAYLGMPFYSTNIVPSLFEKIPKREKPTSDMPLKGRSLITFTDSRQGTARIAIKLQQDAERSKVRGSLFGDLNQQDSQKLKELDELIEKLRPFSHDPTFESLLHQKIKERDALGQSAISWQEAKRNLSLKHDVSKLMFPYYQNLTDQVYENSERFAEALMISNFSRRPKKANSLETLGFVQVYYKGLDKVNVAPPVWEQHGLRVSDWKDFLKICLDFYVRENLFLDIPSEYQNWLGGYFSPKKLLPPDWDQGETASEKKWSLFRTQGRKPRLVRLLAAALNVDLEQPVSTQDQDYLNDLLQAAWDDLKPGGKADILSGEDLRYRLPFNKVEFRIPSKRWKCPVTQKVLDVTLMGITPYLPNRGRKEDYRAEEIQFPEIPSFQWDQDHEQIKVEARQWLTKDPLVQKLRTEGIWTDQSDVIVEGGAFYRTAEHSAQQSTQQLQKYEALFKEGKINVLSCSTTMEMGVDIGGLTMVHNNNVPPHPSNYLQRAGRAGRRKENRALSTTLCKSNPLDMQVFRNTSWPFTTKMRQPHVTLNSEPIVQRHLNAFLFGYFIKVKATDNVFNLHGSEGSSCKWFFDISEGSEKSLCDRMIDWLENPNKEKLDDHLTSIIKGSILASQPIPQLIGKAVGKLRELQKNWTDEHRAILNSLEALDKEASSNDLFRKKLEYERNSHRKTYLISYLVRGGFLPGYGFPTDVAIFNPFNASDYKKLVSKQENGKDEKREDDRGRYQDYPSRDLKVALAEYAPGGQVVLDGKVIRSNGVSLKATDFDKKSAQVIREIFRCSSCGHVEFSSHQNAGFHTCPACDGSVKPTDKKRFLEPPGFCTGFYEKPTNNVDTQTYIPIREPWIDAGGVVQALPSERLGKFSYDTNGKIFFYSSGEHGKGYALCLKCGYAESMPSDGDAPSARFNDHFSLRGKKDADDKKCNPEGAPQLNINLGFETHTDIFELYLKDVDTDTFLEATRDEEVSIKRKTLCWTLGSALRHGLTQCLGINTDEIGITVKPTKLKDHANPVYAICLYDTTARGAGFSSLAPQFLAEMFEKAENMLKCKAKCSAACENCLLEYDTRKHAELLDRNIGLDYLGKVKDWIKLQPEDKLLGQDSKHCYRPFWEEMRINKNKYGSRADFFVGGDTQDWDIASSKLKDFLQDWSENASLLMPREAFGQLEDEQKEDLYILLRSTGAKLVLLDVEVQLEREGHLLAILYNENGHRLGFATKNPNTICLGKTWGDTDGHLLVRSEQVLLEKIKGNEVGWEQFRPKTYQNATEIQIDDELNGDLKDFGKKFWLQLQAEAKPLFDQFSGVKLDRLIYSDRYFKAPAQLLLLHSVLESLPFEKSEFVGLTIRTETVQDDRRPRQLSHNWMGNDDRTAIAEALLEQIPNMKVELAEKEKSELPHGRHLEMKFDDGNSMLIRFDQGMGYWEVLAKEHYPFRGDVDEQTQWISEQNLEVKNRDQFATNLVLVG